MTITTQYKTTAGTLWNSQQEALIADAIEIALIYVEKYRLEQLVAALSKAFFVTPIMEVAVKSEEEFYAEGQAKFDSIVAEEVGEDDEAF